MNFWIALQQIWKPFRDSCAMRFSAAACFYLFLSLPSTITVFLWIAGSFPVLTAAIWRNLQDIIPITLFPWFQDILLNRTEQQIILPLPLLTALWSISKGLQAITDGLNASFPGHDFFPFLHKRIKAFLSMVILTGSLILMLLLFVFGKQFLFRLAPQSILLQKLLPSLRFGSFTILTLFFLILYRFLLCQKLPFISCIWGSMFTSAGWIVFSWLYSYYVNFKFTRDHFYSITSTLILLMLWLQICFAVLFYGAVLAKQISDRGNHLFEIRKKT